MLDNSPDIAELGSERHWCYRLGEMLCSAAADGMADGTAAQLVRRALEVLNRAEHLYGELSGRGQWPRLHIAALIRKAEQLRLMVQAVQPATSNRSNDAANLPPNVPSNVLLSVQSGAGEGSSLDGTAHTPSRTPSHTSNLKRPRSPASS